MFLEKSTYLAVHHATHKSLSIYLLFILERDIQKRFRLRMNKSSFRGYYKKVATLTCRRFSYYMSEINRCYGFDNCIFSCRSDYAHCRYTTSCRYAGWSSQKMSYSANISGDKIEVECSENHDRTSIYCCDIVCRR